MVPGRSIAPIRRRGRGIGAMLLKSAASRVADRYPGSALYLWVFEMNALACQFYARLGGTVVEKSVTKIPSAGRASGLRFSLGIRNRPSELKFEKQSFAMARRRVLKVIRVPSPRYDGTRTGASVPRYWQVQPPP